MDMKDGVARFSWAGVEGMRTHDTTCSVDQSGLMIFLNATANYYISEVLL